MPNRRFVFSIAVLMLIVSLAVFKAHAARTLSVYPGDTVNVENPTTTPTSTPRETQTPRPTGTPTKTPRPTTTPAPTAVACPYPPPTLANTQNPVTWGADNTGVVEAHAAFQNALNNGDVSVPSGTYLINSQVSFPSGRKMHCAEGAIIKTTHGVNDAFTMFIMNNVSTSVVDNCEFRGANYNHHPPTIGSVSQAFFFHQSTSTVGYAGHVTWSNDVFDGIGGYTADVVVYSNSSYQPPPNGDRITCSIFRNSGHYGVQLTSQLNTRVDHNTFTDANCCVEADNTGQQNRNAIIEYNQISYPYGTGWAARDGDSQYTNFLTGGVSCSGNACDFSTNIVRNNSCSGPNSSAIRQIATGGPGNQATYTANTVSNGCLVK